MSYLGIRCSNKDYSFVILKGNKSSPEIETKGHVSFPKGFSISQNLKWFLQEIEEILQKYHVVVISMKSTEALARKGNLFVARIENEAMVYLAAVNRGIKQVFKKVNSTIAKDLGLKGKGKYLKTELDCSVFPDFDKESDKLKDAILVAWSSMK